MKNSLTISLPASFDENSMYQFISQIIYEENKPISYNLTLDFSTLNFIRPSGVTSLHNILQWLILQDVNISFYRPNLSEYVGQKNTIKYLDDCGFFQLYLGEKLIPSSSLRKTTIALKDVLCEEFDDWLENTLLYWIMFSLPLSNKNSGFYKVKVCLSEIFNNISDHSGKNIGCVFAQYYPKDKQIEIAISDLGIGIPNRIREKVKHCPDDAEALKLAIEEGHSTKSHPANRGAGLNNLIGIVVQNNKGSVEIYSNKGILHAKFQYDSTNIDENIKITSKNADGFYPGTLILIRFNTDTLYEEIEEDDFLW